MTIRFDGRVAIVTGAATGSAASTHSVLRRAAPRWWSTTSAAPRRHGRLIGRGAGGGRGDSRGRRHRDGQRANVTDFEQVKAMVEEAKAGSAASTC
jgi:NAD(P)-dependent dehydrogenase (short-subunit alcohol dehydrogenase family)